RPTIRLSRNCVSMPSSEVKNPIASTVCSAHSCKARFILRPLRPGRGRRHLSLPLGLSLGQHSMVLHCRGPLSLECDLVPEPLLPDEGLEELEGLDDESQGQG